MRIGVIGAGAMGSLFGGRLAAAGENVVLYDVNRAHVDAVSNDGLIIEEAVTGHEISVRPSATTDPGDLGNVDVAIVFVKSSATEAVCRQFLPILGRETIVATFQNGLGNEDVLRAHFADRTAVGVTSWGGTFLAPGRVRHAGSGATYIAMSNGDHRRLDPFVAALRRAGVDIKVEPDIRNLIWSKLVINVGINPLTALTGLPNGGLCDHDETKELVELLVGEAVAVAKAKGITLTYPDPVSAVLDVAEKSRANRSSMLQDFDNARVSEIEVINRAIVREAEALGIDVPVNRAMALLVASFDKRRGS